MIDVALANALNGMSLPLKVSCSKTSKGTYRVQCGTSPTGPGAKRMAVAIGPTGTVTVRDGAKQTHVTAFMLQLCRTALEAGAAVPAAARAQLEAAAAALPPPAAAARDPTAPKAPPKLLVRQTTAPDLVTPRSRATPRGGSRAAHVCVSLDDTAPPEPVADGVPVATIDLTL